MHRDPELDMVDNGRDNNNKGGREKKRSVERN